MTEGSELIAGPGADSVRAWTGHRLDEISGGHVGRVEGFFVDESGAEPEWLLARMGRFGHYALVPCRDAVEGVGHVWVPYTRDEIRAAPRVDPNAPLTAGAERSLLDHYGIAVSPDRAAELEQLGADAVSARPG
ncbi:MAG TPA: hypothetical protein VID76_01635 [Solirubrobacterales bacterium]|jgi:hypothetical protein